MTLSKRVKLKLCETFGHSWTYYYLMDHHPRIYLRCCKKCQLIQEWKIVNPLSRELCWSNVIQYTRKGAEGVPGYEK